MSESFCADFSAIRGVVAFEAAGAEQSATGPLVTSRLMENWRNYMTVGWRISMSMRVRMGR
jgi:hypothetical protein